MRMTDKNRPLPVAIPPRGRTATVEALFTVDPERTLAPGDLEEVLDMMVTRIDRALEGVFDGIPARVKIEDISIVNPPHVPFFPATFGGRTCEDQVEVYEAIEQLRKGTPLEGQLIDCAGRAFKVHVWASFQRVEEDGSVAEP